MPVIIDPFHRSDQRHPFKDLERNPMLLRNAMQKFELILEQSFVEDIERHGKDFTARINTANERSRRAEILAHWFRILRDLGHSTERAMDDLGRALRCQLDGTEYRPPPKHRVWIPGGQA